MSDILTFLWAVANNWAGYSTGGLVVASIVLWFLWRDKPMPRKLALWLALLFLLMAFYKAWHDQYIENEVGRSAGSLAFVLLSGELNQHGDLADPQLQINFKNLQPRLLKYHVDSLNLTIESHRMDQIFINRGGYIYAGQDGIYRLQYIKDVPLTSEPLKGILDYSITYNIVGSKVDHHTRKKISFELYFSPPLGGKFSTLDEYED